MNTVIALDLFLPLSKVLLLGSFGYSLAKSVKGECEMSEPFERVAVALIGLSFYKTFESGLATLSVELVSLIHRASPSFDVKIFLIDAMRASASKLSPDGSSVNLGSMLDQVLRSGVWGVMTQVSEFCFLTASFVIECAQSVLSKLLLIVFPVACGLYPITPEVLKNLVIYAFELALWLPVLGVIEIVSGEAAKIYMTKDGSMGLYIIATELVAIILTFSVPMITHKFLAGAFAGDMGSGGVLGLARKWISVGRDSLSSRGGA